MRFAALLLLALPAFAADIPLTAPIPAPPVESGGPTEKYAGPTPEFLRALAPLPKIDLDPEARKLKPEDVAIGPVLVDLMDASAVQVRGADGKIRVARAGSALEPGDAFQTGEHASARLVYEGGIHVLIAPKSVVNVGVLDGKLPALKLLSGEVRALVEATPKGSPTSAPGSTEDAVLDAKPLKFVVATRVAIFGVRGTDFTVKADAEHAWLKVMNGTVDAARDDGEHDGLIALKRSMATAVAPGMSTETQPGGGLAKPEKFEITTELNELHERAPRLEELWLEARKDVKSQRLAKLLAVVRQNKLDYENMKRGFMPGMDDIVKKSGTPKKKHRKRKPGQAGPSEGEW